MYSRAPYGRLPRCASPHRAVSRRRGHVHAPVGHRGRGTAGMQVLGFTLCSNMAAASRTSQPSASRRCWTAAEACKEKFSRLVLACLKKLS